ncbi:hypothetical protein D3C59_28885 [Streptomyces sp. SHP22-7]|nr:hypothetical protein D3C59_28885 [Streptomyces sp. SHP22-7]
MKLGADADVSAVVVKLNPDPVWSARTQGIQVLGRARARATSPRCGPAPTTPSARQGQHRDHPGHRPGVRRTAPLLLQHRRARRPGRRVPGRRCRRAAPDLTVTGLDWSPADPSERDEITVNATVRNAGTARSAATTTEVTVEGVTAGSAEVPALDPGGPPRSRSPPAPTRPGTTRSPPWSTPGTRSPNSTTPTTAAPPPAGWSSTGPPAPTWRSAPSPPIRPTRPWARPSPSPSRCTTAAPAPSRRAR